MIPEETFKVLRQQRSNYEGIFRKNLVKHGKKATGFTSNSINARTTLETTEVREQVFADEAYMYIVEGRPAGSKFPPSIFSRKGRHLDLWFGSKNIPRTREADFLIRRKIARDGINPAPEVLEDAIRELTPVMRRDVEAAMAKDFKRIGIQIFRQSIQV